MFFLISHTIASAKPTFQYARNIVIENFDTHRLLTVKNINRRSKELFQYALVPRNEAIPNALPPHVNVIRTPVERVVVLSTTFVGYLDALNLNDKIIGAANPQLINTTGVQERIANGQIHTVQAGQSLDIESILLLRPDLILTSSSGNPLFDVHPQLARSGLPVVLSAAYMEAHPLARAEWVKFIAAFFEKDAEAEVFFKKITRRYNALSKQTKHLKKRPTVFCGVPYAGVWTVPGGGSYMAQAIHDAGGNYLWADDTSAGGLPLDLERVFIKAAHADIWLHPGSYRTLDFLFAADPRFKKFHAAQTGMIFNNGKQSNAKGGNPIWERGIVNPDKVLADLIRIFHPNLMEAKEFTYYEHLH